ncbi:MAG: MBL fold metallo-hydrolase [Rhodospirillum sp.]|nr:MBL fold metallo-hydrolase [Rhodospirillum sp.]MCF8487771.1 MBL fold metallo-hydrolase [Rhodospirillum sp.]
MSRFIKFWGVRGSIACPSPNHVSYGGNTSCVQVVLDGRHVVLDAGTGLRNLGSFPENKAVDHFALLMTHTHWDHIFGFPFFTPAYNPRVKLDVYAGHLHESGGIERLLASQMSDPMFPVPLANLHSQKTFNDFEAGESFTLFGDIQVRTAPLNHPNGATGYRIDYGGRSLCYITDTEHVPGKPDKNILGLIEGADYVIYDSTYTEEEFPAKVGWGHSTWEEGMRLCKAAGVSHLVIFHHDPDHDDSFMGRLEQTARKAWEGCIVARDGMVIDLGD